MRQTLITRYPALNRRQVLMPAIASVLASLLPANKKDLASPENSSPTTVNSAIPPRGNLR